MSLKIGGARPPGSELRADALLKGPTPGLPTRCGDNRTSCQPSEVSPPITRSCPNLLCGSDRYDRVVRTKRIDAVETQFIPWLHL